MASGYELSAQDAKQRMAQITAQWRQVLTATQDLLQRLADYGPVALMAAYAAAQSSLPPAAQTYTQDVADLQAAQQAMTDVLTFATYTSTVVTRTDNTAGTTDETVTVPAGAYAVVSHDPAVISLLKSVATDKGPAIRKPSPLTLGF